MQVFKASPVRPLLSYMFAAVLGLGLVAPMAPTTAGAQLMRQRVLDLSCVHVYPIQQKYLEKHVNFSKASKNLESRVVDQFVDKLDGAELYLLQSDVKDIQKAMGSVFAKLKKKDCSGIEKAHDIYEKRVKERVEFAKKYLGPKFKFDKNTEIVLDPEERERPKTVAEANRFHQKYLQYQVSTYLSTDMELNEAKEHVVRNYERVLRRLKGQDDVDLWSQYLDSYARALDPHSSYLSQDQLEDFEIQMRLSLEGIGATLSSQDGFTVIEQLIPGGAAFRSNELQPKDKIIAVGQGEKGDFKNVIEMELRDVVRLIRGPKDSKVRLKVLRKEGKETKRFEVTLARDKIKLEDEAASITYIDRELNGDKKKIGLLNLPSFYADNRREGRSSAKDMKKLLKEAKKNNVDAVVLDMSNNGGGSLRDAVDIAGLFFAKGNVVKQSQRAQSETRRVHYEVLQDDDKTVDYSGPLVILTSRISASASEIVSGTLQDYRRGIVVGGDHTFGKGTVQSVEYLPPGLGAIKTTVGMFFTAGGNSTQHRGVEGDIVLPSAYSTDEIGEKTLDYSLPPKKISRFTSKDAYVTKGEQAWKPVDEDLISALREKSKKRVAQSEDFKKIKEDLAKAEKKNGKIAVAELLEGDDNEGEKKDKKKNKVLSREERKKEYLKRADVQEAINIAVDLLAERSEGKAITLGAKDKSTSKGIEKTN